MDGFLYVKHFFTKSFLYVTFHSPPPTYALKTNISVTQKSIRNKHSFHYVTKRSLIKIVLENWNYVLELCIGIMILESYY